MAMQFRQPNNLARAMHQVMNDLMAGQTIGSRFGSEAEVHHVLDILNEVATSRRVRLSVRSTGSRTLEISLAE